MIVGCPDIVLKSYQEISDLQPIFQEFYGLSGDRQVG